jgi:hypothetical protein
MRTRSPMGILSTMPPNREARIAWIALTTLALITMAAPGCGRDYTCSGTLGRSCKSLRTDQCPTVTDCRRVTPRCVSVCSTIELDQRCPVVRCKRDGADCQSLCAFATTADECSVLDLSCAWDGDACMPGCSAFDTADSCSSDRSCLWLECDGQSKPCDQYSGEDCPYELGCNKDPERQFN